MAVRPAVVLARSRCLAVSAVLEGADLQPDPEIEGRVSELAGSLEPLSRVSVENGERRAERAG